MNEQPKVSRRTWLKNVAMLAGATATATFIPIREARAQKATKDAMKYQDQPKDGQECDQCVYFQPPRACGIVEGDISPKGWCVAYNKKK